jgi:alanine dehydrogenase
MGVDQIAGRPLTLGVMGRSLKENERRLPLHPRQLDRIPEELGGRIHLEHGYGEDFGVQEKELGRWVAGFMSRDDLVAECDIILQPKPMLSDVEALREGQVLWGWPHCVQDAELTQVAIDRRLTLVAFEAMNHWKKNGSFDLHVFHRNNELAGYCSVLHALQLAGVSGSYGRPLRAVVIGFGATARGAVSALGALGVRHVDVVTHRAVAAVAAPIHSARLFHFHEREDNGWVNHVDTPGGTIPLTDFLVQHDVIVNCVLQDTDHPQIFMSEADLDRVPAGTVVVDVSCDEGMGFSWARPTTFEDPTFVVGDHVLYYAVDHSPSYLWDSATWEISEALAAFLRPVMDGPDAWEANATVRRAIEIRDGVIQNPAILSFQERAPEYPHQHLNA